MKMEQNDLNRAASYLCRRTDNFLWETYKASRCVGEPCSMRLRFPRPFSKQFGEQEVQLSEQEARTLFCYAIETTKKGDFSYLYSVEVPTAFAFGKEKQKRKISGRSDVTLYEQAHPRLPVLNVEFKCGGIMANNKQLDEIVTKDMKKLLGEEASGLWFHVVKKQELVAITKQLEAWQTSVKRVVDEFGKYLVPKQLIFHLCCLEGAFSLTKTLDFTGTAPYFSEDFFLLQAAGGRAVTKKHFSEASQLNKWETWRNKPGTEVSSGA